METDEKQCSTCAAVKPLARFSFRKDQGMYHTQCKDCRKAIINALRYGSAAELYKEKERVRNKSRREYLTLRYEANKDALRALATAKRNAIIKCLVPLTSPVCFQICQYTGELFASKSKTAKYSKEGYRLRGLELLRTRSMAELDDKQIKRTCAHCLTVYEPVYGANKRVYCSALCGRRAAKLVNPSSHRKRARHYGVEYEPVSIFKVFHRDGWKCRLCGIPTPRSLRGTIEANAPELDHVIPISKGGPHTYLNVQCACRGCNGLKHDKIL